MPTRSAVDIRRVKAEGKTAVMLNFYTCSIGGELDNINMFKGLGICTMQVSCNEWNLRYQGFPSQILDRGQMPLDILVRCIGE